MRVTNLVGILLAKSGKIQIMIWNAAGLESFGENDSFWYVLFCCMLSFLSFFAKYAETHRCQWYRLLCGC